MKKILLSVSIVAAVCLVMTSCLKSDSNYIEPVSPEAQDSIIQAFAEINGFNVITQSDSLHWYAFNSQKNEYELTGVLAPNLYYEIVEPGDMSDGSAEVPDESLGGSKTGTTTVYNTLSDSTLIVSASYTGKLLDGTVFDKTDGENVLFALPRTIYAWQFLLNKVGKGGRIRIITPSIYGYSNAPQQGIPANSPLFFDITVAGFVKNDYNSQATN